MRVCRVRGGSRADAAASVLNFNDNFIIISAAWWCAAARDMENKTSRFTVLVDPRKKKLFLELCAAQDLTPSQVVRQLMREYIIEHAGDRELPQWLLTSAKAAQNERHGR